MVDWKSLKEKAKAIAAEAADNVTELANGVSERVNEAWNSEEATRIRENIREYSEQAQEWVSEKGQEVSVWTREHGEALAAYTKEVSADVGEKTSEMWNSEGMTKFRGKSKKALKVVSGMQAVEDRKKSLNTREEADQLKAEIETTNEALREEMNEVLENFGKFRLEALSATVGKFLHCLETMNQKAKGKEYEFLTE